jgi:hypothetical protein
VAGQARRGSRPRSLPPEVEGGDRSVHPKVASCGALAAKLDQTRRAQALLHGLTLPHGLTYNLQRLVRLDATASAYRKGRAVQPNWVMSRPSFSIRDFGPTAFSY